MTDQELREVTKDSESQSNKRHGIVGKVVKGTARGLWFVVRKSLYVVFLLVAVVLILFGLERAAEFALWKSPMSYIYPEDLSLTRKDLTKPSSQYDYDLNPRVCLIYNQEKGNRYEYANNVGFRDPRDISLKKPDDEFRIFLTGGSTAFGLGAAGQAAEQTNNYYLEHRETIAYLLERILNASAPIPSKTIRVYNTAAWGHAYQHLLFRYVAKLRQYKPDLVVSLDGVNEIHPVSVPEKDWNYFDQGQFHGILKEILSYTPDGISAYLTLWLKNNTFLMALIWRGMDPFFFMETGMRMHQSASFGPDHVGKVLGMNLEERSSMVTDNVSAVVRVVEDYHAVLENDGVPHIIALQPMLYLSKKPRHEMEQRVEALQEHKQYYDVPTDGIYEYICDRIKESAQKKPYALVDFSKYFDDTAQWVFTDWCHVTAGANHLMAKELANFIKEHFLQVPLTEGERILLKDSFFGNPTLSAKVVYAPPPKDAESSVTNILHGYPGPMSYISQKLQPDDKPEVILDLGKMFSLGRCRVVWTEVSDVPKEWAVDTSSDGQSWATWVRGTNVQLDNLSWWPGYEFYSKDPVEARYIRYRAVEPDNGSIGLRLVNVQR